MLEDILKPECRTGVNAMYTLLIVDDEWQTRKGLRELVDWQAMGRKRSVILSASNPISC